jgi:hypothetical protein
MHGRAVHAISQLNLHLDAALAAREMCVCDIPIVNTLLAMHAAFIFDKSMFCMQYFVADSNGRTREPGSATLMVSPGLSARSRDGPPLLLPASASEAEAPASYSAFMRAASFWRRRYCRWSSRAALKSDACPRSLRCRCGSHEHPACSWRSTLEV